MKTNFLKIAGVDSEAEFYQMYPSEEAFFAAHPEAQMMQTMKSGGNAPTNPALWSRAKAAARAKYDVYPSAYANGWAAKWYKSKGGGWRKAEYGGMMADGGAPDNPGFNALPEFVQEKIMSNMAYGGTNNEGFKALPPYVQAKIMSNMANGGQMPAEIARARFAAAGNLDQMDDYGYANGGSTYSGGVWFDEGGMPMMQFAGNAPVNPALMKFMLPQLQQPQQAGQMLQPIQPTSPIGNYKPADVAPTYSLDDMNADIPGGGIINPNTGVAAADAMIQNQFQQQAASTYAKPVGNMPKPKPKPDMNNFNKGLMKAQDKMMSDWADPYSLEGMTGLANNIVEGINNRKDLNANLAKQRYNYSTDGMYNENKPSAMNRGQYDMYGAMAPANQSGMMSFTGMNQKYTANRRFDIGGSPYESMATSWIPGDVKIPDVPFITKSQVAPADATRVAPPRQVERADVADVAVTDNSDIKETIGKKESGNNYMALPKDSSGKLVSSAVGKYQFLWDQHKGSIANITGINSKEAFRRNPEAQERFFDYWDKNILTPKAQEIASRFKPQMSINDIKQIIHFQGPSGATKYFSTGKFTKDAFGSTPMAYLNKKYANGGEVELTQDEIDDILRNGGEVEYI